MFKYIEKQRKMKKGNKKFEWRITIEITLLQWSCADVSYFVEPSTIIMRLYMILIIQKKKKPRK